MRMLIGRAAVEIVHGNLAAQNLDAIVNEASSLLASPRDGAIHAAAGPQLLEACRPLGVCPVGEARITPGFRLKARHVIHTVAPFYSRARHPLSWDEDDDREAIAAEDPLLLARTYRSCLELAAAHGLRSVGFPAISTYPNAYPVPEAARIALESLKAFFEQSDRIELVRFVIWSEPIYQGFLRAAQRFAAAGL